MNKVILSFLCFLLIISLSSFLIGQPSQTTSDETIEQLKKANENLQNQLTSLKNEIPKLKLEPPQSIYIRDQSSDIFISNGKASFKYTLSSFGKIKAILSDSSGITLDTKNTDINKEHIIQFDLLDSKINYTIQAIVLNWDNSETETKYIPYNFKKADRLSILERDISKDSNSLSPDTIKIKVKLNQEGLNQVRCIKQERIGYELVQNLIETQGDISINELGRPVKNADIKKDWEYIFKNLNADSQYKFEITTIDIYGNKTDPKEIYVDTPKAPTKFFIKDKLIIELGSISQKISWKATDTPQDAGIKISDSGGTAYFVGKAKINETNLSVEVPYTGIRDMLKSMSQKNEEPEIQIWMSKGSSDWKINFQIKYIFPTRAEIESAKTDNIITNDSYNNLIKILQSKDNPGERPRINWADLAKTALPLLFTIL